MSLPDPQNKAEELNHHPKYHYHYDYFNIHQCQSYQDSQAESTPALQSDHAQVWKGGPGIVIILKNN